MIDKNMNKDIVRNVEFKYDISDHYQFPIATHFISVYNIWPSAYEHKGWMCIEEVMKTFKKLKYNKINIDDWKFRGEKMMNYKWFDLKDYPGVYFLVSFDDYTKGEEDGKPKTFAEITSFIYYDNSKYNIDAIEKIHIDIFKNCMITTEIKDSSIQLVFSSPDGLDIKPFMLKVPIIDLNLNYGDKFKEDVHDVIIKELSENTKGIIFLPGIPGSGKTMYIRYLITQLKNSNRNIIYIPTNMVDSLAAPDFLAFLSEYPQSILIIEDAENAIRSRKSGSDAVTNLLNISDGLLSDALEIQIIITLNDKKFYEPDEALFRKGRLLLEHTFNILPQKNAEKLSEKLGHNIKYPDGASLSEIYNPHSKVKKQQNRTEIKGFGKR